MRLANEDHCGTNTSALQSLKITLFITQVLAVSQAECFTAVFSTIFWIWNWEFAQSNNPFQLRKMPKTFMIKRRWSTKMYAEIQCKLTSHRKRIATKRPTLQSSKKQNMSMFYSRKRIIKWVKFHLQNFSGLALTILRRCYLTTNTWYAKTAPARRKCLTVCECVSSHPTNPSRQTNHATRIKPRTGSELQKRWFVCQSVGVWKRKANFWRRE